jgi:hypothetical protein
MYVPCVWRSAGSRRAAQSCTVHMCLGAQRIIPIIQRGQLRWRESLVSESERSEEGISLVRGMRRVPTLVRVARRLYRTISTSVRVAKRMTHPMRVAR